MYVCMCVMSCHVMFMYVCMYVCVLVFCFCEEEEAVALKAVATHTDKTEETADEKHRIHRESLARIEIEIV